jgi:hypothetical protein
MASTREKNDPSRFCHEQRSLRNTYNHVMWKYKTVPLLSTYPTAGINMPSMRNGYINNVLSNNACDIESSLLGIGASNLVNKKPVVIPQLNKLKNTEYFDRLKVHMPDPLVIEKSQRPQGPFC